MSTFLSNQVFFRRCRGRGCALLYRLISQGICIPQMLLVGAPSTCSGRSPDVIFRIGWT